MERYLLFDSGCGRCTQIAKDIAVESDGWLQARSLRDEEMQALLKESNPNWHWQPTLVEIEKGGEIEIATGVRLMAKIVMGLGVQRAWRIAKLLQAASQPQRHVTSPDGAAF